MSIFFLSLSVSMVFGLWELCSGKKSENLSHKHPCMGRNSDTGAASEDSVPEVIPLASTAAQLEKLADGAAENVTSKRARVF
ncbi:MAG: hypothetical protein H2035_08855 [Acidimicrobiales bacterium]|nr:hypothetical protein [Acidimicrobiales bacterium]